MATEFCFHVSYCTAHCELYVVILKSITEASCLCAVHSNMVHKFTDDGPLDVWITKPIRNPRNGYMLAWLRCSAELLHQIIRGPVPATDVHCLLDLSEHYLNFYHGLGNGFWQHFAVLCSAVYDYLPCPCITVLIIWSCLFSSCRIRLFILYISMNVIEDHILWLSWRC
jgi:hypothetical protein